MAFVVFKDICPRISSHWFSAVIWGNTVIIVLLIRSKLFGRWITSPLDKSLFSGYAIVSVSLSLSLLICRITIIFSRWITLSNVWVSLRNACYSPTQAGWLHLVSWISISKPNFLVIMFDLLALVWQHSSSIFLGMKMANFCQKVLTCTC